MTFKIGDQAPPIELVANDHSMVRTQDFLGQKRVVLYFYPKDDTPGCTVEACGFRDSFKLIKKNDAIVLGVSPDGLQAHQQFIKKFNLPFLLLADEHHKACLDYGVWVEKNMYGRKYMGVARTTFIIDKNGKIVKIFDKVKPEGHEKEVLKFLKTL